MAQRKVEMGDMPNLKEAAKREHKMTPEMACARRVARAKQEVQKQKALAVKYLDLSQKANRAATDAMTEFEAAKADLVGLA